MKLLGAALLPTCTRFVHVLCGVYTTVASAAVLIQMYWHAVRYHQPRTTASKKRMGRQSNGTAQPRSDRSVGLYAEQCLYSSAISRVLKLLHFMHFKPIKWKSVEERSRQSLHTIRTFLLNWSSSGKSSISSLSCFQYSL